MPVRTRDWLKFGGLVAIAFVVGLAFASTLNLPKTGGAAESPVAAQSAVPANQMPQVKPAAEDVAQNTEAKRQAGRNAQSGIGHAVFLFHVGWQPGNAEIIGVGISDIHQAKRDDVAVG